VTPDTTDTIVAIATTRGPAERGAVRLSGPEAVAIVERLGAAIGSIPSPRRLADRRLRLCVGDAERGLPSDLFVWPDERSYTHQPAVEVHTIGSPPVLDALARACVAAGARLAEPGEFTLRAFLAGRLDLTQAEAVLTAIDADSDEAFAAALGQLAGGLSTPLHRLRADLLGLLADLEAGLDFVEEEDVRFVEPEELRRRLQEASRLVAEAEEQLTSRDTADRPPRVALVGPPNVGKSRLFNALVERYGVDEQAQPALVADQAGVTRDALAATVEVAKQRFQLIDTAGDDESAPVDSIDDASRGRVAAWRRDADLLVECRHRPNGPPADDASGLAVATMADRPGAAEGPSGWLVTSAATGQGLDALVETIAGRLAAESRHAATVTATAERSAVSLATAREALVRGAETVEAGDELVSLELREALDALGRVVGEVVTDEVLGEVFGKFCIGK
jgi:tRNA modification GTPase